MTRPVLELRNSAMHVAQIWRALDETDEEELRYIAAVLKITAAKIRPPIDCIAEQWQDWPASP